MAINRIQEKITSMFAARGFVTGHNMVAGGHWKQIDNDTVISVHGAFDYKVQYLEDCVDFPCSSSFPCVVYIYKAPFYKYWHIGQFEIPLVNAEDGKNYIPCMLMNLRETLKYIKDLEAHCKP